MRGYAALAMCLFFFAATPVLAEFYRWVDHDGKEYYTNEPQKVPYEYRNSVEKVTPDESRVNIEDKPPASRPNKVTSSAHRDKYGRGAEYWRKKAADLRLRLRDQQDDYNVVLKQLDEFNHQSKALSSEEKKHRSSLKKRKTTLEKDIAKTRRRLEVDLVEEAKNADAYPEWVRE